MSAAEMLYTGTTCWTSRWMDGQLSHVAAGVSKISQRLLLTSKNLGLTVYLLELLSLTWKLIERYS